MLLQNLIVAIVVNFIGYLPFGNINLTTVQLSTNRGLKQALIFVTTFSVFEAFFTYLLLQFAEWFAAQPHEHKIVIAGNHGKISRCHSANVSTSWSCWYIYTYCQTPRCTRSITCQEAPSVFIALRPAIQMRVARFLPHTQDSITWKTVDSPLQVISGVYFLRRTSPLLM